MAEVSQGAGGIGAFLSTYGVVGVLIVGLLTYITTWLLERGGNKAKISALEDTVKDYKDWKQNIDHQIGALSRVPDALDAMRKENREWHNEVSDKLDKLGNRISTVEGKLDAMQSSK